MTRLFVAVWLPPDVRRRLLDLPRPDERGVRWVPPEHWHLTVRFLGDASIDEVDASLRGCRWPAPVRADIGPRVSRLGRRIVCLPAAGLDPIVAAVVDATAHLGDPPDPRPSARHVTLARLADRAACGVTGAAFTASFDVHHVDLVQSTLTPSGPVYEVVGTYPQPS